MKSKSRAYFVEMIKADKIAILGAKSADTLF
jgi:hypothetical protein